MSSWNSWVLLGQSFTLQLVNAFQVVGGSQLFNQNLICTLHIIRLNDWEYKWKDYVSNHPGTKETDFLCLFNKSKVWKLFPKMYPATVRASAPRLLPCPLPAKPGSRLLQKILWWEVATYFVKENARTWLSFLREYADNTNLLEIIFTLFPIGLWSEGLTRGFIQGQMLTTNYDLIKISFHRSLPSNCWNFSHTKSILSIRALRKEIDNLYNSHLQI